MADPVADLDVGYMVRVRDTHGRCAQPPCVYTHAQESSSTHVKDYVARAMSECGGLWKHKKTQHALYNKVGWRDSVAAGFPLWGKRPEFPMGEILTGTTKCASTNTRIFRWRMFMA